MADDDFNPKTFIDSEVEQGLFEDLLTLGSRTRILAIQDDKGGMGKSQLLAKLRHRCRTVKPRTPVSLVKLDQLPGDSPLDLVRIIIKDLSTSNSMVAFPDFTQYDSARISKDFRSIRAADLQRATFDKTKGISFVGASSQVQHPEIGILSPRLPERKKLFLASSSALEKDRKEFEIFINRKNKAWYGRGVFIELIVWEDFIDAVSRTRKQDDYNQAIRECDIFVMLFSSKVGQYTEEEFNAAYSQFKATNRPAIFTYFKDAQISIEHVDREAMKSLWDFKDKLKNLGHFTATYENSEELAFKFNTQLDKLLPLGRQTVNVSPSVWEFTSEQDRKAKEVCLLAFFHDIRKLCAKQRIVIMLDAYEKCPEDVKDWIEKHFLEQLFFSLERQRERLILVIAGRETPDFEREWPPEDCATTVRAVMSLSRWTKKDVQECLRVFGYAYTQADLDSFYRLVEIGVPPAQVVQMIHTVVTTGRQS